jgi:two-component system, sensor histidine kinase LadS
MAFSSLFRGRWRSWRLVSRALLLLLALVATAAGADSASFSGSSEREVRAHYWADSSGRASLQDARAAFERGEVRPFDPTQIMPLGRDRAVWFRLQLPTVAKPVRAVFSLSFPGLDEVELFRSDGAGGWDSQRSGDSIAANQWPLRSLTPAFALTVKPGDQEATYLRVRHSQPIRVAWVLQDESSFLQEVELWHLGLGGYGGFIVMVVLLSIFNAVSWRDPIHLYYAVHVVLIGLSIMSLTGLAGEYLWPAHAWWNDQAPFLVPAAGLAWAGLFARELVAERGARIVSWLLLAHVALSLLMMLAFVLVGRENLFRAPSVYFLPGLALLLAVLGWYSMRRPQVGLWVLGGIVLLVAGSLFPLLHNLGVLSASFVTRQGTQLGAALEIPLTLIGLYFRSRARRDNLARLEALAHTDPLTGLGNHRVLMQRLEQLLKRARRDPATGAVLRVQVANLADISAVHGREAAEAALVRAAECVAREASESDAVAREVGNDLVLLMGGQVTRPKTAEAARNIIARGLKFSRRLPPGVTLSLRVSGMCAPLPESDAKGVLATLNRLLLDIGNDQRGRSVRIAGGGDSVQSDGFRPSKPKPTTSPPVAEQQEIAWADRDSTPP